MKAVYFSGTILVSLVAFLSNKWCTFPPIWCTPEKVHYLQTLQVVKKRWYQGVQALHNPWYPFRLFEQFCPICLVGFFVWASAKDMGSSICSKPWSSCLCSCKHSLACWGSSLCQSRHSSRQLLYLLWRSLGQRWERVRIHCIWANRTRRCRILNHQGCRCRAGVGLEDNQWDLVPVTLFWSTRITKCLLTSRTCRAQS